jgi:hypothetical protein
MNAKHNWQFYRSGGVDQVIFRDGADIASIDQLDQKLWMALSMPVRGTEFDPRTADLLDTDHDGRIRPPEVIAAVKWAVAAFKDVGVVMKGGDSVPLDAIRDPAILAGARRLLENLGTPDAKCVSLADVADQAAVYAKTLFNGDGIVPAEAAGDADTRQAIEAIIATMGAVADRSGKPGVNQANVDAVFAKAQGWAAWSDHVAAQAASVLPLGLAGTQAASAALKRVKVKVDDYFARCRLAAFDARALAALNSEESAYLALAASKDLTITSQEIGVLPLARIASGAALPLDGETVNPAWGEAMAALCTHAVTPLLGAGRHTLCEADWVALQSKLAPYEAWCAARPAGCGAIEALELPRLRAWLAGNTRAAITALIQKDAALEPETAQFAAVEKLVRFQRDLFELLTNYVTFADFYGRTDAVFQAGTLYLDARACHLCIEVSDPGKHGLLAGLSAGYLAYCDLVRPGGQKRSIVAVFTNGDSDNLMVGRNGVFYDRQGRDWDATIVKIIANPISVREAFWLPYKKLIRMIEEQVAKRAQAADAASTAKLSTVATTVATADQTKAADKAAATAPKKQLDLGTIALIGTAIGGISALVGGLLQALFGLGVWLPLGLAGVLLLVSGPSMLLAWMKLRQRNLGPILDANGWAINTKARLNVPFGASLTQLATVPIGSSRVLTDPYAEKKQPWWLYILLVVLLALAYGWWMGRLDRWLPACCDRNPVPPPASVAPVAAVPPPAAEATRP